MHWQSCKTAVSCQVIGNGRFCWPNPGMQQPSPRQESGRWRFEILKRHLRELGDKKRDICTASSDESHTEKAALHGGYLSMANLLGLALPFLLLSLIPPLQTRQRLYHAFRLNPDVDWTRPEVQTVWRNYGAVVGRFLSTDTTLALDELLALCRAYVTQHGNPSPRPVALYTLDYELQMLFESSIVLVAEWQPLPTSRPQSCSIACWSRRYAVRAVRAWGAVRESASTAV